MTGPENGPMPGVRPRRPGAPGSPARDYAAGEGAAPGLFPPGTRDGYAAGRPTAPRDPGPLRIDPGVVRTASPEARERLDMAAEDEAVVVTTGQQPLLFLGPLYVLYKALGAIELARRLTREGVPAVALFWAGSDDHDWAEVGRTRVLDLENELRTLRLPPPPGREGRAVGPTPLPGAIEELVDEMADLLPPSEFVSAYLECLRDEYRPDRPVGRAFGATLERMLPGRPLAWVDAADPAVRSAAAPLFDRVLSDPAGAEGLLAEGHRRVEEAGYDVQMPHEEGGLPLFVDRPGGRSRLFRAGEDAIRVGRDGEPVEPDRLREELREHPGRFSPHAALRPVQESWLLPVSATVLGPSEVAYWAQLPPLFDWAGTRVPGIWPRPAWTIVEDKVGKVLEKLGAGIEDFRDGGEGLARQITDRGRPEAVEEALSAARRRVGEAFAEVEEAVEAELPGIRSAVGVARHGAFEAMRELGDAVDRRVREREGVLLSQVEKAAVHLFPRGEPQERVQSPFYYLARYGSGFLDLLEERTAGWASGSS